MLCECPLKIDLRLPIEGGPLADLLPLLGLGAVLSIDLGHRVRDGRTPGYVVQIVLIPSIPAERRSLGRAALAAAGGIPVVKHRPVRLAVVLVHPVARHRRTAPTD